MAIIQNGRDYNVAQLTSVNDVLAGANDNFFKVNVDHNGQLYLSAITDMSNIGKQYGDRTHIELWLKYWEQSESNVGVMLSGPKGVGKSSDIVDFCVRSGAKVIVIDKGMHIGNLINLLITPELNNSIIVFDNFEKHFNDEMQQALLPLFNGVYRTRLCFLVEVNYLDQVNDLYKDRLGRILFHEEYTYLNSDIIIDYVNDQLVNPAYKDEFFGVMQKVNEVTYDILCHTVRVINRLELPPKRAANMLNITPKPMYYKAVLEKAGEVVTTALFLQFDIVEFMEDQMYQKLTFSLNPSFRFSSIDDCKELGQRIDIGEFQRYIRNYSDLNLVNADTFPKWHEEYKALNAAETLDSTLTVRANALVADSVYVDYYEHITKVVVDLDDKDFRVGNNSSWKSFRDEVVISSDDLTRVEIPLSKELDLKLVFTKSDFEIKKEF